jgi:nucleoid DNA-binding protein
MAKLSKQDIIERIAEHDVFETKKAAAEVLDIILSTITDTIADGGEVYLGTSFGGFKAGKQAGKSCSLNGVAYSTPEKQVIKFKPSAALKATVANA